MIIYGGAGALGRHLVEHFKAAGYSIISVDRVENANADKNVIVLQGQALFFVLRGKHRKHQNFTLKGSTRKTRNSLSLSFSVINFCEDAQFSLPDKLTYLCSENFKFGLVANRVANYVS